MMKTNFVLQEGLQSTVDNARGHEVVLDVPESLGGTDKGPKAFELLAMSLNGCIGTMFAIMARKMKLQLDELRVELETEESETIDSVRFTIYVKGDVDQDKVERCFALTEKSCPVGFLFKKAGVSFEHELVIL
ncbi:MAG: OsmC family protein [Porphyromonas sp.]|nr:OsmC family protein [Porphyromonas sp.]